VPVAEKAVLTVAADEKDTLAQLKAALEA